MLRQCLLALGTARQICWIPSWAAKIGNEVELLPDATVWAVVEVYGTADPAHLANQRAGRKSLGSVAGVA